MPHFPHKPELSLDNGQAHDFEPVYLVLFSRSVDTVSEKTIKCSEETCLVNHCYQVMTKCKTVEHLGGTVVYMTRIQMELGQQKHIGTNHLWLSESVAKMKRFQIEEENTLYSKSSLSTAFCDALLTL